MVPENRESVCEREHDRERRRKSVCGQGINLGQTEQDGLLLKVLTQQIRQ